MYRNWIYNSICLQIGLSTKGESNNMDKLQRIIYLELKRVDEVKLNIHVRPRVII